MLSILLYGRNDSHGYNLHKRGAISFNAIAELLTDEDDEIIFVDYNTPDDLPTFPEAIADTLSEMAWRRTRILRVRAAHHERFRSKTHLNALEPIARNVALRRSNAANRWILSTNTDMIFVPHDPSTSLSDIVRYLPDGYYHLPRFELPEALWETLDRKDGSNIINSVRRWGMQFHLNEIVRSGGDNLFDGPGDFQLFLREDLNAIGGFHEEMIRGWHVDANIARRMRILKGEVKSATHLLWGYHCDHTRQATPYHKADRDENSSVLFVDNVVSPDVPSQIDNFGLADVDIEELRLGEASSSRYLRGLSTTVDRPMICESETAYIQENYGRLDYDADHVLPFLLDLVSCVRPDVQIGYVGARTDLFEKFARAWKAMGGERPLTRPDEASWLRASSPDLALATPFDAWLAQSELYIFEVGAEAATDQSMLSEEERYRLWIVDTSFKAASAHNVVRQRAGEAPRRAIAVNAIHNFFERQVFQSVSVKLTPFSSRIRHGFFFDVVADLASQASEPTREAAAALGRRRPFSRSELKQLGAIVSPALSRGEGSETWNDCLTLGAEAIALVDARHPCLGAANPVRLANFRSKLAAARPSALHPNLPLGVAVDAGRGAASRLARAEDWEDEDFLQFAAWLFPGRDHADLFQRDLWIWERIALAQNVWRPFKPAERPNVLFIGTSPDLLPVGLANLGAHVDLCGAEAFFDGRLGSEDWRELYAEDIATAPSPLGLIQDRTDAIAEGFRYDAIVVAQNAALVRGRVHLARLLRASADLLKPAGRLHISVRAQIGADPLGDASQLSVPSSLLFQNKLARLITERTEIFAVDGFDSRISERTFDRLSSNGGAMRAPPLVHGDYPFLETVGVFSFGKRDCTESTEEGWAEVDLAIRSGTIDADALTPLPKDENFVRDTLNGLAIEGFGDPEFGSILRRLKVARGVERTPRSVIVPRELEAVLGLRGFVGSLAPGPYEVEIEYSTSDTFDVKLVVLRNNQVILEESLPITEGQRRRVSALFNIVDDGVELGVALGLMTPGSGELEILDFILR